MDPILAILVYKVFSLAGGCLCIFLGYKLFIKGIFPDSDVDAGFKNAQISIRRAAPSTMFALFGATVIAITINKGFITNQRTGSDSNFAANSPSEVIRSKECDHSLGIEPEMHKKIIAHLSNGEKISQDDLDGIKIYFRTLEYRRILSEQNVFGSIENPNFSAQAEKPPHTVLELEKL